MNLFKRKIPLKRYISVYEILVWLVYVSIYKYSVYLNSNFLPHVRMNFPYPELILYSIATTLYVVPFYRFIGPYFLKKKWHVVLFFVTLTYFIFIPKWCNYLVSYVFMETNRSAIMSPFYEMEYYLYRHTIKLNELLTDLLAFFSVMFMRYAFETEQKKHALEKDNLVLQLETLKAQLHPHFLFNTLNSVYGMSLSGEPETPAYILRLSNMMRYILYDCQQNQVALQKDLEFLDNYLEMEKKRYPLANISFTVERPDNDNQTIAPLLLIPFLENSFKHGSHRIMDSGFIEGRLSITGSQLHFHLSNSVILATPQQKAKYGGVGIENVRKRLALYYPGRHELEISHDETKYTVNLKIALTK